MTKLIDQLVKAAVARVPKEIREQEVTGFRKSLMQAHDLMCAYDDQATPASIEKVLRVMAKQYCPFRGQQ
jgi:hypothetical protein